MLGYLRKWSIAGKCNLTGPIMREMHVACLWLRPLEELVVRQHLYTKLQKTGLSTRVR